MTTDSNAFSEGRMLYIASLCQIAETGIMFPLFIACILTRSRTASPTPQQSKIGRCVGIYLSLIFLLKLLCLSLHQEYYYDVLFVRSHDPVYAAAWNTKRAIDNTSSTAIFILIDSFMIWRCYVIWGCSRRVIILPILGVIATIASHVNWMIASFREGQITLKQSTITIGLSIANNLLTTILILIRIIGTWIQTRDTLGRKRMGPYTGLIAILIESAGLGAIAAIGFIITANVASVGEQITISIVGSVQILSTLFIILRVNLGSAITEKTLSLNEIDLVLPTLTLSDSSEQCRNVSLNHDDVHTIKLDLESNDYFAAKEKRENVKSPITETDASSADFASLNSV